MSDPRTSHLVWHYTVGKNLPAILRAGVLMPGNSAPGEHPAVWFSRRQDWEPSTAAGYTPDVEKALPEVKRWVRTGEKPHVPKMTAAESGGFARIGVAPETAPYTWQDFVRGGGIDPIHARAKVKVDTQLQGSDPADWRLSLDPVPASKWVAVERLSGRRWVSVHEVVQRAAVFATALRRSGRR